MASTAGRRDATRRDATRRFSIRVSSANVAVALVPSVLVHSLFRFVACRSCVIDRYARAVLRPRVVHFAVYSVESARTHARVRVGRYSRTCVHVHHTSAGVGTRWYTSCAPFYDVYDARAYPRTSARVCLLHVHTRAHAARESVPLPNTVAPVP